MTANADAPRPLDASEIDGTSPVLIAGPTGSGKSALALDIARLAGGIVVNADALQVYAEWRILTARPPVSDESRAPHALYGHVPRERAYSVGHWLREVEPLLEGPLRPIIVGGTGLYFSALTEGLAEVPQTPPEIRAEAAAMPIEALREGIDCETLRRIDAANPARLRRAWEVQRATGRGLAEWQDVHPRPLLPPERCQRLVVEAPKEALTPRLEARFDAMLAAGALEEVRAHLDGFDPARPGDRAIGAAELADVLRGTCDIETARQRAIVATRRYAKRQRTWFRSRMASWRRVPMGARIAPPTFL